MKGNEYIIDINEGGQPYNVRLVLPLPQLQQILPLVKEEMMHGLVNNDTEERVVLHLQLSASKIVEIEKLLAPTQQRNKTISSSSERLD